MQSPTILPSGANPETSTHSITQVPSDLSEGNAPALRVIKRDGTLAVYRKDKIGVAITKAVLAVEGDSASDSTRIKQIAEQIVADITARFWNMYPNGASINIEDIQDQVELGLMRQGMQQVARAYVLYREEHARKRERQAPGADAPEQPQIMVSRSDGTLVPLDRQRMQQVIAEACAGLSDVEEAQLLALALKNIYSGIKEKDVATALIMAARPLIEQEPNYSLVCARLLLDALRAEVLSGLGIHEQASHRDMQQLYPQALIASLHQGVTRELLDETLLTFDLERLGAALCPDRDLQFNYLGLQTLYDRYFLHWREVRFELPQTFFMRVAMGLAAQEDDPTARAIEFYDLLSSFDYMSSTPTLFNSGTRRPQLSSCYLTTVPDSLDGIYDALKDNALLSKWAGGLGNDWSNVRALGAQIKGTNGQSQGVVPFLKVVNDTAVAVNQGGKRKGAVCAYLETWHLDIEDFLDLRKNTGDERRRTHDMNSANWIPDLFMQRVFEKGQWTLFSPSDVPDLHDLYGREFAVRYAHYERLTESGEISLFKRVPAEELWRKILSMLFETGHPWITFKDPCNIRSPQQHVGVVHSSNLCTEITLNTSDEEIAVCNLGSINLVNHIVDGKLDRERLQKTVSTAIRMLDNVVDINYYAVPQAREANLRHRPIGLGVMGFQDALYEMGIPYASVDAVYFADNSMELISYLAIEASIELARERGSYQSYEGSLWQQGVLPIDSLKLLAQERGEGYSTLDYSLSLNWQPLREQLARYGMRNSNVMAIAPTATISNIVGVSQSIEPTYQNLFVKSNLSGEFTVVNPALVKRLKRLGLWDAAMVNDLKYFDGSLKNIERVPETLKELFATAFEMDPLWLVEAAARRQKWIDQAQSLNLYMSEPSGKRLDILYKTAWSRGLKTTYYLRSLGATHMEKSVDDTAQEKTANRDEAPALAASESQEHSAEDFALNDGIEAPAMCSILDPDCEACQ